MKRTRSIWLAPLFNPARRTTLVAAPWVLFSLLIVFTVACSQKSPEEKIADLRSHYTAELNGFIAKPNNPPLPEPMESEEGMDAEGSVPAGGDEATEADESEAAGDEAGDSAIEEEELPLGPLLSDISLDIIVRHDARENLAGITIDVTQAGVDEVEKGSFRFYLDTSKLARGQQIQVTHVLENVDYQDGDGFFTEVRHPVPVAERSAYREFTP